MPTITPKSPDVIKAQVATFAAEGVPEYRDKEHVFNNLGRIAAGDGSDEHRTTTSNEYGDNFEVTPAGTTQLVARKGEYQDFLRAVGGANYEPIRLRADMIKKYEEFAPFVQRLKSEFQDPATRSEHDAYLARGLTSEVFTINVDGDEYVVRIPTGSQPNPSIVDSHVAGAVLGHGVPHLEQITAISYEDGVTVAEKLPGKQAGELTVDDINHITSEQVGDFVDTLLTTHDHSIEIDPKPSNFIIDRKEGYGIVDYHSSKIAGGNSENQTLQDVLESGARAIGLTGLYGKPYKPVRTEEDFAHSAEVQTANLRVLQEYRQAVAQKVQPEEGAKALATIDEEITATQKTISEYTDPEWVARTIADEVQWRKDRAEMAKNITRKDGMIVIEDDFV